MMYELLAYLGLLAHISRGYDDFMHGNKTY